MNKCEYAKKGFIEEILCLGTKEMDICPCYGNPFSKACYCSKEKEKEEKEIHFYYNIDDIPIDSGYYLDWKETLEALENDFPIIRTTAMGILTYSARLFDAGYRIFIYDDHGEFELTLGNCARTNREIRYAHNHFKMWVSGEFTNYCIKE